MFKRWVWLVRYGPLIMLSCFVNVEWKEHHWSYFVFPLDSQSLKAFSVPPKSKFYVILVRNYERNCVAVVHVVPMYIHAGIFNIYIKKTLLGIYDVLY